MTLYNRRPSQPLKYVITLLLFIIVMGFTWSDVYGYQNNDQSSGTQTNQVSGSNQGQAQPTAVPVAIPEPGTLILLGGGLGALYLARRSQRKKN